VRALVPLVALALLTSASPAAGAAKAPSKKNAEAIRTLREQVEEASATEAELLDRFDSARGQRQELDGRVAEVDRELAKEQVGLDDAATRLNEAQAELVGVQLQLDAVRGNVATAREELRRRALASYIGQPGAQAANVFLRVRSIHELSATRVYLHAVVRTQSQVVLRLRALQHDVERLEAKAESTRVEARAYYDEFAQRTARLQDARAQQEALRQVALQAEQQESSLLTEARDRKAEFEAEIAALQGDSRSLEALLRARQTGPAAPPHAGTLSSPIPFAVVTSPFGPRVHPIYGTVRMHNGIDLRGGFGTPILAAADGEVVWAGPRGGYGNMTVIDHGTSLATAYGHQQTILVQVGQQVTRGQVIGLVGSTGMSTGPHLHFEVRVNGVPVNPLGYL
jgi:murein DD-endopeptidase MepM/ murein hydrolase activator NlpD